MLFYSLLQAGIPSNLIFYVPLYHEGDSVAINHIERFIMHLLRRTVTAAGIKFPPAQLLFRPDFHVEVLIKAVVAMMVVTVGILTTVVMSS